MILPQHRWVLVKVAAAPHFLCHDKHQILHEVRRGSLRLWFSRGSGHVGAWGRQATSFSHRRADYSANLHHNTRNGHGHTVRWLRLFDGRR
jgi:hypothetical protein